MRWFACLTIAAVFLHGIASAAPGQEDQNKPENKEKQESAEKPDAPKAGGEPLSFAKDVAPILVKQCIACHGEKDFKGEYQVHTYEAMLKAGAGAIEGVLPGKPEESELYNRISTDDETIRMPLESDPLAADQVALIKRWIAEGANFDGEDKSAPINTLVPKIYPDAPEVYPATVPITALAFSPDGNQLAVGGYHEITLWNPADGKLVRRISNVAQRTYALAYSPDGKVLAAASGTPGVVGEVKLFDPATGEPVADLATMSDCAFDVNFNATGDRLAAAAADRSIRVFDVAGKKELVVIEDHADWVMAVAFSPDGKLLASASRDKTSKVFDAATGEAQTTYNGHGEPVFGVAFNADGKQVFTSGGDRKIHVWNPADGKKAAEIAGFGNEVYELVFVGGKLFSCSADKTAREHEAASRKQLHQYSGHADWVYSIAVHPGSKRLATGSHDGEVRVWNTDDAKQLNAFTAAPGLAEAQAGK